MVVGPGSELLAVKADPPAAMAPAIATAPSAFPSFFIPLSLWFR
jgi:hypothetical protein